MEKCKSDNANNEGLRSSSVCQYEPLVFFYAAHFNDDGLHFQHIRKKPKASDQIYCETAGLCKFS